MIKLANTLVIGLIASSLLVGCGGGSDSEANEGAENAATEQTETSSGNEGTETNQPTEPNNGNGGDTTATPPPSTPNAKTFGANVMPVLNAKCKVCHGDNGRFSVTSANATYNNIVALKGAAATSGKYLMDKGSGSVGHGGGTVITTSSAEYTTIKSWVDAGAANN